MIELPPFDALALSLHHAPGVHAILVGSGLSRAAGIPTGWEITLDLVRRLAALDGVTEHDDWAEWYRGKYKKEPSYSEMLDALASTPSERRAIIHGYMEPQGEDDTRQPTKAHHAIAQLVASGVVRIIVTTNFDRLIENALRDIGIEPTVIASDDAIAGATPLVHAKCTVIKVHGDYLDARIKNTDAELETYSSAMDGLLDQVFDNFGLLAVGWSGEWDLALRAAIQRAPSRRYPFYWAARGGLGPLAQDLLDQRGGRSFPITDADSFFTKLDQTLKALQLANRPHPQSVEMAVALAKRYCRDDKFAMEWAEFLEEEAASIRDFVTGPKYPRTHPTAESLSALVTSFIDRTEVLRRVSMVCGRWGTEAANAAVSRTIQSLSFAKADQSGFTANIKLRDLAASLTYYWNLAGLVERKAWDSVAMLLNTLVETDRASMEICRMLAFQSFRSVDWKFLKGFENHHTPMSDCIAPYFLKDAKGIALDSVRAEALLDRTEMVAALGYGVHRLKETKATGNPFWVPLGRLAWTGSGQVLENELKRYESLPPDDFFISSQAFGPDKQAVDELIAAIREFWGKIAHNYW